MRPTARKANTVEATTLSARSRSEEGAGGHRLRGASVAPIRSAACAIAPSLRVGDTVGLSRDSPRFSSPYNRLLPPLRWHDQCKIAPLGVQVMAAALAGTAWPGEMAAVTMGLPLPAGLPGAIRVSGSGEGTVNTVFRPRNPQLIPAGFERTCIEMNWPSSQLWDQLSERLDGPAGRWWWESDNESYIYFNKGDGQWWIDGPSGAGFYVCPDLSRSLIPPPTGWTALEGAHGPVPRILPIESGSVEQ